MRILVTGAGRGIGFELCRQALDAGWSCIATIRNAEQAHGLSALASHSLDIIEMDVTSDQQVKAAALKVSGPINIVINNAGVIGPDRQSTLDMDFTGFAETLAVNTIAPLRIVQAFLPHLKAANPAKIITISSQMGMLSYQKSDRIAYRASKSAVNKVMQGLATDLAPVGIAVQAIHPGWVRTDMGGPEADLSPQVSAAGILQRCRELDMSNTGTFLDYSGNTVPW